MSAFQRLVVALGEPRFLIARAQGETDACVIYLKLAAERHKERFHAERGNESFRSPIGGFPIREMPACSLVVTNACIAASG